MGVGRRSSLVIMRESSATDQGHRIILYIKWERVVVDKFGEHGLYLYVHREMLSNTKDAHLRRKSSRASVFVIYCVARFNLAITFTSVQTLPVLVYDGQEDNGRTGRNDIKLHMKWRSIICRAHDEIPLNGIMELVHSKSPFSESNNTATAIQFSTSNGL